MTLLSPHIKDMKGFISKNVLYIMKDICFRKQQIHKKMTLAGFSQRVHMLLCTHW